jgi:hypothetical protein
MKIRSITCFVDPRLDPDGVQVRHLAEFCSDARESLASGSIEVQSTRISTPPFPLMVESQELSALQDFALSFSDSARDAGFGYASCGPSLPEFPPSQDHVVDLLQHVPDAFFGSVIADQNFIYPAALRAAARTIKEASTITPDGFANLRFAALANTRPYGPFYPGSYSTANTKPAFSLAIECADAVLAAFRDGRPLELQRDFLLQTLEGFASGIASRIQPLADEYSVEFKGFDFSPAPFPDPNCSLGAAVEALGIELGRSGALASAAVIADTLSQGNWKRAGYNGLMLPVLEDSLLAQRAAEGKLHIHDLLLFSAVCGTGLDTVPLPGDVSLEALESILWDMAALAVRLGKPLTARLMPIPGKKAGDLTAFDFGYFANSRVMSIDGQRVHPPLNSDAPIRLTPRIPNSH